MTTMTDVISNAPPVCAGCGNEVDPQFAHWTTDYRQVCTICAKTPRWKPVLQKPLGKKARKG